MKDELEKCALCQHRHEHAKDCRNHPLNGGEVPEKVKKKRPVKWIRSAAAIKYQEEHLAKEQEKRAKSPEYQQRLESLRRFIVLWYECETLPEFCSQYGCDRRAASNTAANLRRSGVVLKLMPIINISNKVKQLAVLREDYQMLRQLSIEAADARIVRIYHSKGKQP